MADKMKAGAILNKALRMEGETLTEFVRELGKLTPEDKEELIVEGAKTLGVEVDR